MARLERRRQLWYVVIDVPKDVQKTLKKRKIVKSTGEESKQKARIIASTIEAKWRLEFDHILNGKPVHASNEEALLKLQREATAWRARIAKAADLRTRNTMIELMKEDAREYHDPEDETNETAIGLANTFVEIALGEYVVLSEHLEGYLAELRSHLKPKTVELYEPIVREFCQFFPNAQDITSKGIRNWLRDLHDCGRSANTINRYLTAARGFWRYLLEHDIVSDNVDHFSAVKSHTTGKGNLGRQSLPYVPFSPKEVTELLRGALEKRDAKLAALILLGMWTGARIDSLCSLRLSEVSEAGIHFSDKTDAGNRHVPIHSRLRSVVEALALISTDGFLLSGLSVQEKTGTRSDAIGKRFGRLKTSQGYVDRSKTFHSIRKTVVTQLEQSNTPENITAAIVGHEVGTMTYGLYSNGPSFEQKQKAIETLTYPEIDRLTEETIQLLTGS